jgi:hypothetical protein
MEAGNWLLYIGAACLIVAVVGGGLRILQVDFPVLTSIPRQILLAAVGVGLMTWSTFKPSAHSDPAPTPADPYPHTIALTWSPTAPQVLLPPPGSCNCVSSTNPQNPNDSSVNPHPPYPAGATSTVTNNCPTDIQMFVFVDRSLQSMAAPYGAVLPGRSYGYTTLHPGQTAVGHVEGVIAGGGTVGNCPLANFVPASPVPLRPH